MTRGLVLGKFAPFHRGHELLVQRSLAKCEETVVLVYDSPEVTRVPLPTRANWIRNLYPAAHVIECVGAPGDTGDDPRVMRLHEDYIRRVVPLPITHFFSSEWYGAHVAASLGAEDVRVDEARTLVPISGTEMRRDAYTNRQYVSPIVYRDLVRWVVLVGAESTGKSTLAAALAEALGIVHVPEHGREYWEQHHDSQGQLSPRQLVELAQEHRQGEEATVQQARRILIVDTDACTTRQYARWYHAGHVEPELQRMAEDCLDRYHLTVLCGDDIPYVDDGTRAGTQRRRQAQDEMRKELAQQETSPWIEVKGALKERVDRCVCSIRKLGLLDWA